MKLLYKLIKINFYGILTFLCVGLIGIPIIALFGEEYAGLSVLLALVFWLYILYKKYKDTLSTQENNNNSIFSIQLFRDKNIPPKSAGVIVMGFVNILLFAAISGLATPVVIMVFVSVFFVGLPTNSIDLITFNILVALQLLYIVVSVSVIFKSFYPKSSIRFVRDSNYIVFWPVIIAGLIVATFFVSPALHNWVNLIYFLI